MATASPTEGRFSQVLQCPICLETLCRPKVLPCGHTYCASCLQSHINSKVINGVTSQACFPCPVCRADTTAPDTTVSVEQWAESFPVNSIVSSLLDLAGEKYGDKFCDICQKWNRKNSATSFCKDCKRLMCKICKEHHDETLSHIRHDVIDLNAKNASGITIPNLSFIEICPRHLNKGIEFFCRDHNSLCCSTCGFLEHRKCERVITIDDMIKTFDMGTKSKDVEENLHKIESHMKQMTSKVKESADNIKTDKSSILQQIRSLRSELNVQLQKLEDVLVTSLERNHKTEDLSLQTQEARGQSLITAIDSDLTQLDLVMTHGSEVQKVIMLHNMEKTQNRYLKAVSEYQEDIRDIKFGLELNTCLKEMVNDLNGFGEIKVIRSKPNLPHCPVVTSSQLKAGIISLSSGAPLKDRKAVKVSEFNVKLSGESSCYITDVITLQGEKHILLDYTNEKIKVYGQDYQFQESMTLQGGPWNVCILPDNHMAVTVPYNKTIMIIRIAGKMFTVREIRTRLQCWGIGVLKDHLVTTTQTDEHRVMILDMTGTEVRNIQPDNYRTANLTCPLSITMNQTYTVIYISYYGGQKMVAFDTSWNVLFTYTNQKLQCPHGLDVDRDGNIYVCGYSSNNIQQISADGKLIKILITKHEDPKHPAAIRFYKEMDRFIVTFAYCDGVVEVYDMCD